MRVLRLHVGFRARVVAFFLVVQHVAGVTFNGGH
jgi:hypothetical protein